MRDRHRVAVASPPVEVWPPDDTEESVVGTNLHQETIGNLRLGLNEVASALAPVSGARPWQALSQTGLSGLAHPDGSPYTVLPDIFVYNHAIDNRRATLSLAAEGPPLLIVEVLSEKTHEWDLDMEEGKGYSYARAGVPDYLILDPTGEYVPEQGQGWRLQEGVYVPWVPGADRRWHSQQIAAAVGFEGVRVAVYTPEGQRQLREGEVARRERQLLEELARRDREMAELRRRLDELTRGE